MSTGRSRIEHQNVPPTNRSVQSVAFDVMMVPGVTERGPLGATVVTSYDDYVDKFGTHLLNYRTSVQVQEFFKGGGQRAVITRIMHWDANGNPATGLKASLILQSGVGVEVDGIIVGSVSGPFSLADGDTLEIDLDAAGVPFDTATFNAAAAVLTNHVDGPWALTGGSQITFEFNGNTAVTVTFGAGDFVDIAAATAAEVVVVMNRYFGSQATASVSGSKILITSGQLGTGSSIDLVETGGGLYGADANDILHFPVAAASGSGDAVNAASVTLAELATLIVGDVAAAVVASSGAFLTIATGTPGAGGSVQIDSTSTMDAKLGLDNNLHSGTAAGAKNSIKLEALTYGTWGNDLSVAITDATSAVATEFNLEIYESSTLMKTYRNLTMDDTSTTRFAEHVVNTLASRSKHLRVTDLDAAGAVSNQRPANIAATSLTGGNDGLTDLATADYTGSASLGTGLHAFSSEADGDVLVCEDETSTTFQNAATAYASDVKMGKVFYLPQAPAGSDADGAVVHVGALTSSEVRSGLLWPWVKVPNPDKPIFGQTDAIIVSPVGLLAGRMRRNTKNNEKQRMWVQPGNQTYGLLDAAVGLETEEVLRPDVQDRITDAGINPVLAGKRYADSKYGVWVNDVQAGKTDGNFKSVGENRGVSYLRKVFEGYLEADRTQGNTETRRRRIERAFTAELSKWTQAEVFETTDAETAFYVNADVKGENLNNPVTREDEELKVLVGIATGRAARFMTIMFTRDNRAVESFIQQQMAATSTT